MQAIDSVTQTRRAALHVQNSSTPPRILFLTDAFLPHAGGARVYYYHLFRELVRSQKAELTILTKKVPKWKEFDAGENGKNLRIVRCGRPLENWKYYQWPKIALPLARLLPLLARERFDLIHFGDLYPQGVLSLLLKRAWGLPYVAYCHGEEITQVDGRRYQPRVRDAIFRGAEKVVAANEFARQNLVRIGVPEPRIEKITPGVDCVRFRPGLSSERVVRFHDLQDKKVLLTVARLVPRKGHRTVLEALRLLLPKIPNLAYVIAGTGPEEENLRRLTVAWGLSDAVRFAGFVKDEDLPAYYNACDLYVMPNTADGGDVEGFGMVFLEANACGKVVVGGRSGGAAEAILHGKTGMLVDPSDPQQLADVVRMLLQNDVARSTMAECGKSRAQSEFSWTMRANQLHHMNQSILSRVSRSKPFA